MWYYKLTASITNEQRESHKSQRVPNFLRASYIYLSTGIEPIDHNHLLRRPRVVVAALAVAVLCPLPLPLRRLAVAVVLVPGIPVLDAKRRCMPVPLAAVSRRVGLAAVPAEDVVVMVVVLLPGRPAATLLVRVRVFAVVVVVVVGVRVVASASPVLRVRGLRLPEHVLPAVVQRVEQALLVEKPQQHRDCNAKNMKKMSIGVVNMKKNSHLIK